MKISIVVMTVDVRSSVLDATLENLTRSGIYKSPFFGTLKIVRSKRGEVTAQANAAAALRTGADAAKFYQGQWVLFLEDDIDVIDGFLDAVGRWLEEYASDDRRIFSFAVPHPAHAMANSQVWDYPIDYFCCTQAFAIRCDDALSLANWFVENPRVIGPDGKMSTGAYDLSMRAWAHEYYPTHRFFSASVPSFVQHVGEHSVLTPNKPLLRMPSFPGRHWTYTPVEPRKRRLLWVGDACCQTGFARNTHGVLHFLQNSWDVSVLGINHKGDPHPFSYPCYPCAPGGDALGHGRIQAIMQSVQPDLIVLQNDPWNIPQYIEKIQHAVPTVGVIAVDGKNCRGDKLEGLDYGIFWTQFGLDEARAGGFTKPASVIPIGIDNEFWCPGDRDSARRTIYQNSYESIKDAVIFLNINRNQERKRFDLTLRYFAEFVRQEKATNAILHLHVAPTGDHNGYDCEHLAKYYGILDQVIFVQTKLGKGPTDLVMREVYRAANVGISTTQGEGMGLTTLEGMACGLPQILPDWSALGEWARVGSLMVPCTTTAATTRGSVIGGVADEEKFIECLKLMYMSEDFRRRLASDGHHFVQDVQYRWNSIASDYEIAFAKAVPRLYRKAS